MERKNIFDYLYWRGDLRFSEKAFNELDALVLNMVSFLELSEYINKHLDFDGIKLTNVLKSFFDDEKNENINLGLIIPDEMLKIALIVLKTRRYQKIKITDYVNVIDDINKEQFSALTFFLDEKHIFVSFRGTDDTLIGWAEDFNMLSTYPIPAQKDARKYLNKVGKKYQNATIYVGGHSKGGNLSVYASVYCYSEISNRIEKIYSLDGPGFFSNQLDSNRFNKIKNKILHIIPNGGVVGRLFNFDVEPIIVKSNEKGLNQHNPFSWLINVDHFEIAPSFTKKSDNIKREVDKLISEMSSKDRIEFTSDVNNYLDSLKQNNLIEFLNIKNVISLVFNRYRISRKNIKYLIRLYRILRKNGAVTIKIKK